jgi:hypothetical protein
LTLEQQRQFICVLQGSTAEQHGRAFSHRQKEQPATITLKDAVHVGGSGVTVFAFRISAFSEMQPVICLLLDKFIEQNPFYDVAFCGHSYGAAMETLAAHQYACAWPTIRAENLVMHSCKVRLADFCLSENSTHNLKVMHVEHDRLRPQPLQVGRHVGHSIRMHPSVDSNSSTAGNKSMLFKQNHQLIKAYRFGGDSLKDQQSIASTGVVRSILLSIHREKDICYYVTALENVLICLLCMLDLVYIFSNYAKHTSHWLCW